MWPKVIKDEYLLKSANNATKQQQQQSNNNGSKKLQTRLKNIWTFLQHFRKSLLTSCASLAMEKGRGGKERGLLQGGRQAATTSVPVNYALISSFL